MSTWTSLDQLLHVESQPASRLLAPVALAPVWSRQDFIASVRALAAALQQDGVTSVALLVDDAARFGCALLACAQRGITIHLPPNLADDNIGWADGLVDLWLTDRDDLPVQKPCRLLTDDGFGLADEGVKPSPLRLDTRLVLKTSGSTGQAQIVEKTLAQFAAEAEALRQTWGLDVLGGVDAVLGSVSPQHLYGLSFRVVLSLCAGWPIHRAQCAYPETLLDVAQQHPRTVWISSPVLLNHLGEDRVADALRGRIALLVSAGGSLPDATRERMRANLGVEISDIYGSTESGVIAWRRRDAAWQVLPPAQWGMDARGALWVESPWSNGRQQMSDVIEPGGKGFVLQGRLDRIIKLADKRISLQQVEHALLQHAWVQDAHTGLHPVHRRLAACVALTAAGVEALREQGRQAVVRSLRAHLLHTQDRIAMPRSWRFDTTLPRNAQGKLRLDDFLRMLDRRPTAPEWQIVDAAGTQAGQVTEDPARRACAATVASDEVRRDAGARAFSAGPDRAAAGQPPDSVVTSLVAEGTVPLDLIHFGGHFPRFPIVPGVIEIDWVMQLARRHFACPQHLFRADALKFRQLVRPGDAVRLTLDWRPDQQRLGFSIAGDQGVCASGRLLFADVRPESSRAAS